MGKILELKNTIYKIKKQKINGKLHTTEEKISELEHGPVEVI